MKILKFAGAAIAGTLVVVLGIALVSRKEYRVEREIVIQKPVAQVFEYVRFLKNQDNYSVWARMDPAMKKDFRGTDGTVGAVQSWDSQNPDVGRGEQEIKAIETNKRIDFELRFFEPFEAQDHAYMTFESPDQQSTRLKWGFHGSMKVPMNLMLFFMDMEGLLGSSLADGLSNLKALLEKQ